jgi:hypothetical protein
VLRGSFYPEISRRGKGRKKVKNGRIIQKNKEKFKIF